MSKIPDLHHRNLVFILFFHMITENTAYVTYHVHDIFSAIKILSICVVNAVKGVYRISTRIQTENKPNI